MKTLEQPNALKTSQDAFESRFIWPPLVLAILALWILPMATSLGLDETGGWWVVKDGWHQAIARHDLLPGSLLFDLILIGARKVGGDSDLVMRVPTLLASFATLWVLYRLGVRLIGRLGAGFACLAYVTLGDVVYIASTARPYSLGLLFVCCAMLALLNWFDSGRFRYAASYVVSTALSFYMHYFFAVMLLVHAAYWWNRPRRRPGEVRFVSAWAAIAVSMLPLAPVVLKLAARGGDGHVYLASPETEMLLKSILPLGLIGSIVLVGLVRLALRKELSLPSIGLDRSNLWLLAAWWLTPILATFALSSVTPLKVFTPRYYIAYAPGMALLAGACMARLGPRIFRLSAIAVMTVCSFLSFTVNERASRGTVDWRGAAAAILAAPGAAGAPVIGIPAFYESRLENVLDPRASDGIFAPYLRYGLGSRLIRVPGDLTPEVEPYLTEIVNDRLKDRSEFFVIGLMERYSDWLRGRLAPLGFVARYYGNYGGVEVVLFEKRAVAQAHP